MKSTLSFVAEGTGDGDARVLDEAAPLPPRHGDAQLPPQRVLLRRAGVPLRRVDVPFPLPDGADAPREGSAAIGRWRDRTNARTGRRVPGASLIARWAAARPRTGWLDTGL